jgi:tyrosine-protein phosphatase YwqE
MVLKNILQLYALVVCTITVIMLLIISCVSITSLTSLVFPEYTHYSTMGNYESNEAYIRSFAGHYDQDTKKEASVLKQLPSQELSEKRIQAKNDFLEDSRRKNISLLIYQFEWALIAFVFFYIHWRIYKKATKNS